MTGATIDVLLVEDDSGDVELTREALAESKIALNLRIVEDGERALQYLRREGKYADAPRPDLILLDLNLPRVDGREVLREIKSDPDLRAIPVCVVTTSDAESDILKSYGLGANCYVTKPIGLEQFVHVIRAIEEFWLTIVKLPPGSVGTISGIASAGDLPPPRPASPPPSLGLL